MWLRKQERLVVRNDGKETHDMKRDPPQITFVGEINIDRLKRFLESIGYSLEKRGEGNEK